MSDPTDTSSPGNQRRRMSIADIFSPRSSSISNASPPSGAVPATPDVAHHRRGVSISTLGLNGSSGNTQTSPFDAFARQRRASIATSSAASSPEFRNSFSDEHAVIEEDDMSKSAIGSPPSPSFARRVSFGAQALRDVRQSGANASNGGRRPSSSLYTLAENSDRSASFAHSPSRSSETAKARGEGFNWSEALRDKTMRSPSFSSGNPFARDQNRLKSAVPTSTVEPPKEMPKQSPISPKLRKPDHIGERMLRGDFMMD